jgi:hypothetical protein
MLSALTAITMNGCMQDTIEDAGGENAPYLLITTNAEGNGYAATFGEIPSGEVDIAASAHAIQVQTGWGSGAQFQGRDFFIIASYTGVSGVHKYSVAKNGVIKDGGVLTGAEHFLVVDAANGFYFDPALGKLKIQTFNPATMERTGEINLKDFSRGDNVEVAGDQLLAARGGKLFTSLVFGDSTFDAFALSKYDTGFVAVIDIASKSPEKVIKVPGAPFGFGYPADMQWSFQDDNGDLYLISPFKTPWSNPGDRTGQIFRIPAGKTDFDSWKLDTREYGEHRSLMSGYAKGGKLYMQFFSEPIPDDWSNFTADILDAVVIDVITKQKTVLEGSPKFRFNGNSPVHEVDGKIFYSVLNKDFNGVYALADGKLKPAFTAKSGGAILHFHKVE